MKFIVTLPLDMVAPEKLVDNFFSQFPRFFLSIVLFLMLVLGVINQYFGTAVNSWLNTLEISIEKRLYKILWSISN